MTLRTCGVFILHDSENDHAILCYGNERTLITTRQRILEMIGIPVAIACSEEELAGHLSRLQVEVLLLCQTLSPAAVQAGSRTG